MNHGDHVNEMLTANVFLNNKQKNDVNVNDNEKFLN